MSKKLALGLGMVLLLGFVVVSACQPSANGEATAEEPMAQADAEPAEAGPSLYERLGGTYAIAAVADDLIDRLAADEALNANPAIA